MCFMTLCIRHLTGRGKAIKQMWLHVAGSLPASLDPMELASKAPSGLERRKQPIHYVHPMFCNWHSQCSQSLNTFIHALKPQFFTYRVLFAFYRHSKARQGIDPTVVLSSRNEIEMQVEPHGCHQLCTWCTGMPAGFYVRVHTCIYHRSPKLSFVQWFCRHGNCEGNGHEIWSIEQRRRQGLPKP